MKQLSQIERREARLRRIQSKLHNNQPPVRRESVAKTLKEHHHIALSQNFYEHIGTFLQKNVGDPAIQVKINV